MQDSGTSVGYPTGKEAAEIMVGVRETFDGLYILISHHPISFRIYSWARHYSGKGVNIRWISRPLRCGHSTSPEGGDASFCGMQFHRVCTEEGRHFGITTFGEGCLQCDW